MTHDELLNLADGLILGVGFLLASLWLGRKPLQEAMKVRYYGRAFAIVLSHLLVIVAVVAVFMMGAGAVPAIAAVALVYGVYRIIGSVSQGQWKSFRWQKPEWSLTRWIVALIVALFGCLLIADAIGAFKQRGDPWDYTTEKGFNTRYNSDTGETQAFVDGRWQHVPSAMEQIQNGLNNPLPDPRDNGKTAQSPPSGPVRTIDQTKK